MTCPSAAVATRGGGVRLVPASDVMVRFLPLWLAWLLVVVFGRLVCRLAQRIPPVVRLVRRLRAEDRRWARGVEAGARASLAGAPTRGGRELQATLASPVLRN